MEYVNEIGLYGIGFDGIIPISFQEIEAWDRLTQTGLTPFEASLIKHLSNEFVSQYNDKKLKSVPPINDWDTDKAKKFYGDVIRKFQTEKRNG